jgi:hypothetical protein
MFVTGSYPMLLPVAFDIKDNRIGIEPALNLLTFIRFSLVQKLCHEEVPCRVCGKLFTPRRISIGFPLTCTHCRKKEIWRAASKRRYRTLKAERTGRKEIQL